MSGEVRQTKLVSENKTHSLDWAKADSAKGNGEEISQAGKCLENLELRDDSLDKHSN